VGIDRFLCGVLDRHAARLVQRRNHLLQLVAVGVGIQTVLTFYLTVYLPYGKGLTDSSAWSVYCPRVIPVLTAVSVITFLILVRAVWPVWGLLAPLILSVEGLGLLFALQFVPSW
jgi:hypothetical protein